MYQCLGNILNIPALLLHRSITEFQLRLVPTPMELMSLVTFLKKIAGGVGMIILGPINAVKQFLSKKLNAQVRAQDYENAAETREA